MKQPSHRELKQMAASINRIENNLAILSKLLLDQEETHRRIREFNSNSSHNSIFTTLLESNPSA